MAIVKSFTFNPFQENTYVVYDDSQTCVIIDPGCYDESEQETLMNFIQLNHLRPVRLLNTHTHIDHVLGNAFVCDLYGLLPEMHRNEVAGLQAAPQYGYRYGFAMTASPLPVRFLDAGDEVVFGNTRLYTRYTPGHSPASLSFYCPEAGFVLAGDVLFKDSIGRTDLPGGDYSTLLMSIKTELLSLPDDTVVYAGHGNKTTIGRERRKNPFLTFGY